MLTCWLDFFRYVLRPTVEECVTIYDLNSGSNFIKPLCELAREGLEINAILSQLVCQAGERKIPVEGTFDIPTTSHNTLRKKLFLCNAMTTKKKEEVA